MHLHKEPSGTDKVGLDILKPRISIFRLSKSSILKINHQICSDLVQSDELANLKDIPDCTEIKALAALSVQVLLRQIPN